MLWVFAPAVVVVDVVEDDDGHPLTAVGREGLEVKKSRDRPCPVLHPLGQLVVTQGGGLRAQSGPQHRDDRGGGRGGHPITLAENRSLARELPCLPSR